jgi:serine phosphatase RsbU (regulator of sigma subunit)
MSSPGDAFSHANSVIYADQHMAGFGRFVTVALAVLTPQTGHICYSSAGHPPPVLCHNDRTIEFLNYGHPPLSLFEKYDYGECEAQLNPGEKIVFYTDGISEAHGESGNFDLEGIERTLTGSADLSPDDVMQTLLNAAVTWAHGKLSDDVAIVVIQRNDEV